MTLRIYPDLVRQQYDRDGYVVIPTGLPEETLRAARDAEGPLQPEGYHWSDGPRVFEAWKQSQAVRDVSWCPAVLSALEVLHDARCRPFQTINFRKGTNQRLHQDAVHFQTLPLGEIVGVWVAFEPMDEDNGTLCVAPGSHKRGYLCWNRYMGLRKCEVGKQFEEYKSYENMIGAAYAPVPIICSAGDAVIWGANLLHGGWPIKDDSRTRYSQATHYYTDRARVGWAPMFSNRAAFDFHFKSMRWFDRAGHRHEQHELADVGLYT